MTLAVLSSTGCPSIQVPPGKGLHKKTLFLFMLMRVVVNVPAGSFRGQKMVSTPNWELKVIGGGEPLDTGAENLNSGPLQE